MTSSALVLSSQCTQPHQETSLYLRQGPGLTVYQLAEYGAKYIDLGLNAVYRGPIGPKDKIDKFFSNYEAREGVLDELYKSDRDNLTKQHKKLQGYCRDLLKYANAQSHTICTQLVTFKMLVSIITRYPGVRRLFYDPKGCGQALSTFKENWTRTYEDCGEEWNFYLDYTLHCLSDSELTALVEKELPSELGRLELPEDWNKVPIEELLSLCSTIPEFSYTKLSAIRYLAGVLELPTFWEKGISIQKRFSEILTVLCYTILRLIEDTGKIEADVRADRNGYSPPWMLAARNGTDSLASATFDGLLRLHGRNQLRCPCPPDLSIIVVLLQRWVHYRTEMPRHLSGTGPIFTYDYLQLFCFTRSGMTEDFPRASDRVSLVHRILPRADRETTDHRANSPRPTTHSVSSEHNSDIRSGMDEDLSRASDPASPVDDILDRTERETADHRANSPRPTTHSVSTEHNLDIRSGINEDFPRASDRASPVDLESIERETLTTHPISAEHNSDASLTKSGTDEDFQRTLDPASSIDETLERPERETTDHRANSSWIGIKWPFSTKRKSLENSGPDDLVIVVIGPTGVGKSSFINTAADEMLLEVDGGLSPCTKEFGYVRCTFEEYRPVVFVDTPAFPDPDGGNASLLAQNEVGKMMSGWLKEALGKHIKVTGILYLHDISTNRLMEPLPHYEISRKLCGNQYPESVVLVLTKCEKVKPAICQKRKEYLTNHWKRMMGESAAVYSHYGTKKSAWDIVTALGVSKGLSVEK